MRAREFLFEYNRAVTANQVGNRLIMSLANDDGNLPEGNLTTLRSKLRTFARSQPEQLNAVMTPENQIKAIDMILAEIEKQDPTPNKVYTPWLAKMYAKAGGGLRLEDVNRMDLLRLYDIAKKRRRLKPEHMDINRFKFYHDFEDEMENSYNYFNDIEDDTTSESKAKKVYEDDNVMVIVPEDEAAACKYGRGTRWCTAAIRGRNYFNDYNKEGPLYIIIPKNPMHQGEKYQFHFPSGQFMNERDDEIDIGSFFNVLPKLKEFFYKNDPESRSLVILAPNEVLQDIMNQINPIVKDYLNEVVDDQRSSNDDEYYHYLVDLGYTDENGDVDYDKASDDGYDYLSFDSDLNIWRDRMEDLTVDLTPMGIREMVNNYSSDSSATKISKIPEVLAENVSEYEYRSGDRSGLSRNFARFLLYGLKIIEEKDGTFKVVKT